MARIRLLPRAQADFDQILDYLRQVTVQAVADRYADDIRHTINRLQDFPRIGRRALVSATTFAWSSFSPIWSSMNIWKQKMQCRSCESCINAGTPPPT